VCDEVELQARADRPADKDVQAQLAAVPVFPNAAVSETPVGHLAGSIDGHVIGPDGRGPAKTAKVQFVEGTVPLGVVSSMITVTATALSPPSPTGFPATLARGAGTAITWSPAGGNVYVVARGGPGTQNTNVELWATIPGTLFNSSELLGTITGAPGTMVTLPPNSFGGALVNAGGCCAPEGVGAQRGGFSGWERGFFPGFFVSRVARQARLARNGLAV
jgi:hypothetical protein